MHPYLIAADAQSGSSGNGGLILFLMVAGWVAYQVIAAKVWPFARCRACDGKGRNSGSNRNRWGRCRKCDGTGRRERFAVRLFASRKD
ncbi:MAG: hypothetical protein QOE54_4488 [Streptosporangiaceae bacterium]|jgi:hypothetical protein|nr:hypothetical protein [Streptosporangiaceae bacterium]MDX6432122.1 hypothetical protein [Streptosporangiaceae bacterium]